MNDADNNLPDGKRSDRSLLRRVRVGRQDAATALYLRYARRLEALARAQTSAALATRIDPEDVVQSVFRTFFRRAAQGQYDVPPGEELWQLLLVIALNKIRALGAYHRAAKRDVGVTTGHDGLDEALSDGDAEGQQALLALRMVVEEVLGQLPQVQREMIQLRIEGHDVATIADRTRRSKRSVERVLQNFRQRLSRLIDGHERHQDD